MKLITVFSASARPGLAQVRQLLNSGYKVRAVTRDASKLKNLGINIIHNLPGVGKNLQDHLMFRPVYRVKNIKTLNKKINSLIGKMMIGMEFILFKRAT